LQQALGFRADDWEFQLQHIPDNAVVNESIAVDKNVAERNDALMLADARSSS
jgi:hypothetical protein